MCSTSRGVTSLTDVIADVNISCKDGDREKHQREGCVNLSCVLHDLTMWSLPAVLQMNMLLPLREDEWRMCQPLSERQNQQTRPHPLWLRASETAGWSKAHHSETLSRSVMLLSSQDQTTFRAAGCHRDRGAPLCAPLSHVLTASARYRTQKPISNAFFKGPV